MVCERKIKRKNGTSELWDLGRYKRPSWGHLANNSFHLFLYLGKMSFKLQTITLQKQTIYRYQSYMEIMLICILSHTALANTNMAFFIICIVPGKALMATRNFTILWCLNNICTSIANYIFNPIAINTCTYPCSWFKVQF